MDNIATLSENQAKSIFFNRMAYVVMLLVGIIFLFLKDWSQGTVFISLALVFNPFDQSITFNQRPLFQKIWLIAHAIAVVVLFSILIFGN
jgi:asparagine N-glycosylation enzyme membrane subunit Stt3